MTELHRLWADRSDDQIRAALEGLSDYNVEAQAIIRAEQVRRGIEFEPPRVDSIPLGNVQSVTRLHRTLVTLVAGQWLSLAYLLALHDNLPPVLAQPLAPVSVAVLMVASLPIRIISGRLLAAVDADSNLLTLTALPLFGAILVVKFPQVAARWAARNGVSVTLTGSRRIEQR